VKGTHEQMKTIKIAVQVSLAASVAAGRSQYGDATVELSDADVASLSDAARAVLAASRDYSEGRYLDSMGTLRALEVSGLDGPTVLAAIEARVITLAAEQIEMTAREERRRAAEALDNAERHEQKVAAALAAPDTAWLCTSDGGRLAQRYSNAPDVDRDDPRIVAHLARITAEVLPAYRAELAAAKAAEDERHAAYAEAIRTLGATYDDLARAVTEGYDVERAVIDRLAESLAGLEGLHTDTYDSPRADPTDRAAPSPEAFRLRDRVVGAVREANERLPVAIGRWEVSRIVRVDVCPHSGEHHYVTAVLATLLTLGPRKREREITFSLESLECAHDDERADDE
jgi:hypothetical protein